MSYTPENQRIDEPIRKLTEAIKEFDSVVDARIDSNDWKGDHIIELSEISLELRKIRIRLTQL